MSYSKGVDIVSTRSGMIISADKIQVEKHFIGHSVSAMRDLLLPLKRALGIDSFSYVKLWSGCMESYLTSDPDFCEAFYQQKLYKNAGVDEPSTYQSGYVLLDMIDHEYCRVARDFMKYQMFHILKRTENHCEIFIFAMHHDNPLFNNIYLNNLHVLESYIEFFKDVGGSLILGADKNLVSFPELCIDTLLLPQRVACQSRLDSVAFLQKKLTAKEMDCILLALQGFSAKEIAIELNISYRTVEKHFQHLLNKFNCHSKMALYSKLKLLPELLSK